MINIFDIREKSGKIFLIGRDENNKRVIIKDENNYTPFHGEFYVKEDRVDELGDLEGIANIYTYPSIKKSIFGDKVMLVRYDIQDWLRVKELRTLIDSHKDIIFEGDLWGKTIYCLDKLPTKGYGLSGNWKVGYIDIETNYGLDIEKTNEEVLCLTVYDTYTEKYHFFYWGGEVLQDREDTIIHYFQTEKEMLDEIVRWLIGMEFDVVTGWNVNFDVSYLLRRFLKVSTIPDLLSSLSPIGNYRYNPKYKQFTIDGLCIFDLLESYKRIVRNQLASFKLDNVAEEELGEHKIEVNLKGLITLPREQLLAYNRRDVELCLRIDKKVNIFNFFDGLRQFVGCPFEDTRYSRSLIDFMLLKKSRSMGIVLPTASNISSVRGNFEGAFVDAVQGNYNNVIAFDIAGLYPNIIKTFNLSPECCVETGYRTCCRCRYIEPECECKEGFQSSVEDVVKETVIDSTKVRLPELTIDMSKEGIIPSIVNDLMVLRKKYDEERDKYPAGHPLHEKNDILVESAKLIVDAIYGITAYPGFRLHKTEIASSITYIGREIIQHTKQFIEERSHRVVVTDTDSSYFTSTKTNLDDVVVEGKEMLVLVNKEYPRWVQERWGIIPDHCYLKNVLKKVYRRIIVGTKKRYVGNVVWAKGIPSNKIEVVGAETKRSDYSRFARDFQYGLMKLLLDDKEDDIIRKYILYKIDEMKLTPPTLIGIPTKIEKELDEYTTNLPKVRGSEYSGKIIGEVFKAGDKPLLLFTEGSSDVILFFNDNQAKKLLEKCSINWVKMTERNIVMLSSMLLKSCKKNYIFEEICHMTGVTTND